MPVAELHRKFSHLAIEQFLFDLAFLNIFVRYQHDC